MARLQRKLLRRKMIPQAAQATIKRLNTKPVIKNVDIEAIKQEFAARKA